MSFSLQHLFIFAILVPSNWATNSKGLIALDSETLEKISSKFRVTFLKFDVAYPYGEQHDAFAKLATQTLHLPDVLVGEIGVKDYGDMENLELAKSYGLKTEDFPAPFLFIDWDLKKYKRYKGDITLEGLKKFLKSEANVYIPLEFCLPEFDDLAENYVLATQEIERAEILKQALKEKEKVSVVWQKRSVDIYILYLEKMHEKDIQEEGSGIRFIKQERERLQKLMKGKVSDKNKEELNKKFNIILSFITPLELKEMEAKPKTQKSEL